MRGGAVWLLVRIIRVCGFPGGDTTTCLYLSLEVRIGLHGRLGV